MQKQILASIIIPVYNKCDYTKHCLESLVENISESYFDRLNADFEVIIVDNASTDKTKDFLKTSWTTWNPYSFLIFTNPSKSVLLAKS